MAGIEELDIQKGEGSDREEGREGKGWKEGHGTGGLVHVVYEDGRLGGTVYSTCNVTY